jgi:hypothetical protein
MPDKPHSVPVLVALNRQSSQEEKMSKIVRFPELGGPEVLKIEDVASMQPSKDEVAC